MPTARRLILVATAALLAAACTSTGASPSASPSASAGSPSPSGSPSSAPSSDGIEHPTGSTDVVLRYEEAGGFVPQEWAAGNLPWFTLYGDGTVVFQQLSDTGPRELPNGVIAHAPLRIARLSEDQMQQLLRFALTDGGLAIARDSYTNDVVADASTATFILNAGGIKKTVAVYALGIDPGPNTPGGDVVARAAFGRLAQRLRDFDNRGTVPTDTYVPAAFRGMLFESGPVQGVAPVKWPWKDLTPADFATKGDPSGPGFPSHTVTLDHLVALGVPADAASGTVQNVFISGPGGKLYSFVSRPLLPGEAN